MSTITPGFLKIAAFLLLICCLPGIIWFAEKLSYSDTLCLTVNGSDNKGSPDCPVSLIYDNPPGTGNASERELFKTKYDMYDVYILKNIVVAKNLRVLVVFTEKDVEQSVKDIGEHLANQYASDNLYIYLTSKSYENVHANDYKSGIFYVLTHTRNRSATDLAYISLSTWTDWVRYPYYYSILLYATA